MSARALLEELRERGIRLKVDGLMLRVDAPTEADTAELRTTLRAHKRDLIRLLERERLRLEEADRRGLVIRWSREPGYVSIHDPTTGEWHEVAASGCPPWVLDEAKARRRFGGLRKWVVTRTWLEPSTWSSEPKALRCGSRTIPTAARWTTASP